MLNNNLLWFLNFVYLFSRITIFLYILVNLCNYLGLTYLLFLYKAISVWAFWSVSGSACFAWTFLYSCFISLFNRLVFYSSSFHLILLSFCSYVVDAILHRFILLVLIICHFYLLELYFLSSDWCYFHLLELHD